MTTNTATITACDKLLAKLTIAANRLPSLINNIALMICENPADLAGRSIKLLDLLEGTRQQKNVLAFFDDYLQNSITKERGKGYTLGKKRDNFTVPELDPTNLPFAYKRPADAVERLEKQIEKARNKKIMQEQHAHDTRKAQLDEAEKLDRFNEMERERLNAVNSAGALRERVKDLSIACDEVNKTRVMLEGFVKKLEAENAELEARNAELEARNAELEARIAELEKPKATKAKATKAGATKARAA